MINENNVNYNARRKQSTWNILNGRCSVKSFEMANWRVNTVQKKRVFAISMIKSKKNKKKWRKRSIILNRLRNANGIVSIQSCVYSSVLFIEKVQRPDDFDVPRNNKFLITENEINSLRYTKEVAKHISWQSDINMYRQLGSCVNHFIQS